MTKPTQAPLESRIRQARRRLGIQTLLNRVGLAWGLALAVGLVWFLVGPFVYPAAAPAVKWAVLGTAAGLGTVIAGIAALRSAPSRLDTALALDGRFGLQERVTTALSLSPRELASPAGQALVADANTRLERLGVSERFPIRVGRRALFLPAQAALIAVLALYPPTTLPILSGGGPEGDADGQGPDTPDPAVRPTAQRPFVRPPVERANKSEELRQLEAELAKLYAEHNRDRSPETDRPEQVRERQEKIAAAEDLLKKREQEMTEKFQRLQEQMEKLTELDAGESAKEGPAQDFEQALARGDLKKAQEDIDQLQKKAKERKLDPKEQQQLKDQLKAMEDRLDKLSRDQQLKKQQLKDLIEKARKENRDAESLERELKNLEQELQMNKETQQLAQAIKGARQALEQNDFDGLSDQLGQVSKQLADIQDDLQDLEDIEEHLQNLKEMKKAACKECEGKGKDGEKGSSGDRDDATGYAEGATGRRAENKDAKSKEGEEKRVRGFFDARGRKTYAGSTTGPAFKQATSAEMSKDIRQAVQEAPEAVEVQRLPRAARDMVKEYFENLGGQVPPAKK